MISDIHITDLNAFTGCRRRWNWQSTLRRGLQKAVVPEPLFTGLATHIGLDAFHSNHDNVYCAVSAAKQWMKKRVESIIGRTGAIWDDERNMINESHRLTTAMLKHYALWHRDMKLSDKWEVIGTEQLFTVPIPVPQRVLAGMSHCDKMAAGMRLKFHDDARIMAWYSGRIQLSGRFDGLIRERGTGDIYLLEFKTARTLANTRWVMRGLQGTAYVYAAQQLHPNVRGILYRILRKKAPAMPKPLVRGGYSQAKSQDTSFRYFKHYLRMEATATECDPRELYRENEKILRHLHGQPEKFFLERKISKSPPLIKSVMETIYYEGTRMINPSVPIFANSGWSTCAGCPFQDPCDLLEMGLEEQANDVLDAEYAPRKYWEV